MARVESGWVDEWGSGVPQTLGRMAALRDEILRVAHPPSNPRMKQQIHRIYAGKSPENSCSVVVKFMNKILEDQLRPTHGESTIYSTKACSM